MLTPPDGFLPAASLYQGKLSFRCVENNARLSFFADLVIAGIQFSFQLFYQRLTEADRTILTRIALLQICQFGRGGGESFKGENDTYLILLLMFSLFFIFPSTIKWLFEDVLHLRII